MFDKDRIGQAGHRSAIIELASGRLFDILNPDAEAMTLDVIAAALSNSCRFAGHVRDFYSVAQHSVLVAVLAGPDLALQRAALLHDAEEAFGLSDMVAPAKPWFPTYVRAQDRIMQKICRVHGISQEDLLAIKPADRKALWIEKAALKSGRNEDAIGELVSRFGADEGIRIVPLPPREARAQFLQAVDLVFHRDVVLTRTWLGRQPGFVLVGPDCMEPSPA